MLLDHTGINIVGHRFDTSIIILNRQGFGHFFCVGKLRMVRFVLFFLCRFRTDVIICYFANNNFATDNYVE